MFVRLFVHAQTYANLSELRICCEQTKSAGILFHTETVLLEKKLFWNSDVGSITFRQNL